MGLKTLAKTEDNGEIKTINCLEVTKTNRYLFFVEVPQDAFPEEVERLLNRTKEFLDNWLESNDKFGLLAFADDVKIMVERVNDEPNN